MRRSPILTTRDFNIAELSGMRLRGDLTAIGECWIARGEPLTLETRCDIVAATLAPRQIADRWTAAWVWGAVEELSTPYQTCVTRKARLSRARRPAGEAPRGRGDVESLGNGRLAQFPLRGGMRELDLLVDEVETVRDLRVTSVLRTALDLLREADEDSPWPVTVGGLLAIAPFPDTANADLRALISDGRFAVRARRTSARLDRIEADLPATAAGGTELR